MTEQGLDSKLKVTLSGFYNNFEKVIIYLFFLIKREKEASYDRARIRLKS